MKFLACYKDSSVSDDVIRLAQQHAKVWKANLEIVKAIKRDEPIPHSKLKRLEDQFDYEVTDLFENIGLPYNKKMLVGNSEAGEQIIKYAEKENVDLIFVGIKKRSKLGKLLFGSTVQYIVLNAPCPVVTINPST